MDEEENDVLFKFNKPDGSFLLHVETPAEESGWEVHPDREPMEVCSTCMYMYQLYDFVYNRYTRVWWIDIHQVLRIQVVVCQYMLNLVLLKIHFTVQLN